MTRHYHLAADRGVRHCGRAVVLALALGLACDAGVANTTRAGKVVQPLVGETSPGAPPEGEAPIDSAQPLPHKVPEPPNEALVVPPDWPAILDGLPDLDLTLRERAHMELSRRIEKRGLKAMRADQFDDAVERFFEAIEVDPGNVDARYNLACALSRTGDRPASVAMLGQLRDEGCGACLGKVLKARRDSDFDPIRKSKAFVAVVTGAERNLAEAADTAMAVAAWTGMGKKSEVPLAIDPRRKITVRVGCPSCRASKAEVAMVRGDKALRTWVERKRRAFSGGIAEPTLGECKGKCCTFALPDPQTVSPDVLFLAELCFRIEAGVVTSLSKLSLHRYPPPPPPPMVAAETGGEAP
ncbi:MAG: tetratricopeptide repeat protein [Nannocystaceae bacterium]|nr:tetratricopeptide repeat protein [Nannocystaceae bacterium]